MPHVSTRQGDPSPRCTILRPRGLAALLILLLTAAITLPTQAAPTLPDRDGDKPEATLQAEARMAALLKALAPPTETKITASDGAAVDQFGRAVSIDGNYAIVGSYFDDSQTGSAYVFFYNGTAWVEQAKLTAGDAASGDQFGSSVAISGSRAIVGAPLDDDAGPSSGSAYVFLRSGTSWSQEAKLTASDAFFADLFGTSVSIDGTSALVGAPFDDDAGSNSGSAYVFDLNPTWMQTQKLVSGSGAANDQFGTAVSLDGSRALIGAPINGAGFASVWDLISGSWSETQTLAATGGASGDRFGTAVSLDGSRALIGAPRRNTFTGSAFVFDLSGTWMQTQELTANDGAVFDQFGNAVALDGSDACIGAPQEDNANGSNAGSAYTFSLSGTWMQSAKVLASDGMASDNFGFSESVALSGNRAIIGAPNDDDNGPNSGSAYIYDTPLNNPPALTTDNDPVVVNEGLTANNTGTVTDPDLDTVTLTASVGFVVNNNDGTWSWSWPTTDGPADSQLVTISGDDGNGGMAQTSFTLTVNNVPPTIDDIDVPIDPTDINDQPVSVIVDFSDPADANDNPYTCDFDYDDDSVIDESIAVPTGTMCTGTHTYADPGVYPVTVTVTDKDGGSDTQTTDLFIVIFDPSEGFVTGGGWFVSPPGAYPADTTLTGHANFGFVSKYKKNSNVPQGQTEFQFQAANLNFHSESYEWMAVFKDKATYHGTGTINGTGTYDFLIIVTDAALSGSEPVDLFRIRIKDTSVPGNPVIYDNRLGEPDNSNAGTPISGGSIVIHKKGGGNKRGDEAAQVAEELPTAFALGQNYPNPFNPTTAITFELPEASQVELAIFNVMGRRVATLVNEAFQAGRHEALWQAGNLPSGTYFYRITAGDFVQVRRMLLVK